MRTLNKEEMLVVYLALMICRQLGFPKPPKRQVLNVVESWKLMKFYPEDLEPISSGTEPKWRNDLAWAAKNWFSALGSEMRKLTNGNSASAG